MKSVLQRLWPRSLSGRLAMVLIAGMLAAQALTGTIWYDMRYGKAMEIPTRLAATRLADAVRMLDAVPPASRLAMFEAISSNDFKVSAVDGPSPATPAVGRNALFSSELFLDVLRQRLGDQSDELSHHRVRVLDIRLTHAEPNEDTWFSLLHDAYPSGHFIVQLRLHDGQWLQAEALEGQAGMSTAPRAAAIDYLLRIYLLRIAAVILLAWLAVRLVMQPLGRLADAADKLGKNIFSAPLATSGPTEVRKASQAFNAMQQRLIDNIAERTRFLAAVSHDLRSPITRLKLRTELLPGEADRIKFRRDLDEMDALVGATLTMVQDSGLHEQQQTVDIDSLLASLCSRRQGQRHGPGSTPARLCAQPETLPAKHHRQRHPLRRRSPRQRARRGRQSYHRHQRRWSRHSRSTAATGAGTVLPLGDLAQRGHGRLRPGPVHRANGSPGPPWGTEPAQWRRQGPGG
jgi:signal transduction histidine kinase